MTQEELKNRAEVLTKLAGTDWLCGDFSASLKHFQEALELYQKLGDLDNVATVHLWLGRIFCMSYPGLADEAKAMKHAQAALTILEPGPDTPQKGLTYQLLAALHLYQDKPATSVLWAEKAIGIFEKLGIFMGTSLGTARAWAGELDRGIEYQENNWEPTVRGGNAIAIAICGLSIILSHTLARNIPVALKWEKIVVPEITRLAMPGAVTYVNWALMLTCVLSGKTHKATETFHMVEGSETAIGGTWQESASLGLLHFRLGEWDKANEVLQAALSAHEGSHNHAAINGCSFALGSLNLEQGNYLKAEELLLRSLEICQNGGNVIFELWVLPVLAELYLKMGQLDKAAEYVDRGFELMKPDQNWYGLPAPIYLAKGMLAAARKDWGTAAESFDKSIQINRQYQLPWDEARTLYERGLMYLARGRKADREKAHEDMDEALAIFQKVGARKDVEKVLRKKEMLGA
ncbi:MAG: tetratricopeptide repeat protein [Chloroflexi bacterium]|nr:tetratricopeptide repeat protein [Chloroflexota bacterium]